MRFGADYYPEHWPEDRWPVDAELMAQAGMNVVRLAEFAWSKLEPEPGSYDFGWLDRAIAVLASEGIDVVLGTPTATPPKWMMDAYPDIYPRDRYGRIRGFGSRRHYCPNSPEYIRESARITAAMADRYGQNPAVIAWQIDNEFGCHDTARCYCPACLSAFRIWLKEKYADIDNLNEAWGTVFWSQTYRSWDEVILPEYTAVDTEARSEYSHNPGLLLDFYRFSSDSVRSYQKIQIDEIRTRSQAPISHNFMGHFSDLDYYDLAEDLDFITWDNYPANEWGKTGPAAVAFAHDIMRGVKRQPFWVMEEQSGPCGWNMMGENPEPGQIRLWAYQAIARGADGMVFFRWRVCSFGTEEYWHGILGHDGVPRRRYQEVKRMGEELPGIAEVSEGAMPTAEIALVKSYDDWWSHQIQPHSEDFTYASLLSSYYNAFHRAGITVDVIPPGADFSSYKAVLAPGVNLFNEELAAKVEAYVNGGGILATGFRSGTKTMTNSMTTLPLPGYLAEVTGIEIGEFDILRDGRTIPVAGNLISGTAAVWCDIIDPKGAEVLASYSDGWFKNSAAVTKNSYGKGTAYYTGCQLDDGTMDVLAGMIIKDSGASLPVIRGDGLEVVEKRKDGSSVLFVLNHTPEDRTAEFDGTYTDLLTGQTAADSITLEPYAVAVLSRSTGG